MSFLSSVKICQIEHYRGQRSTGTWVIEATEFKFEVRSDLGGHMEATMASEVSKMAVPGNIHIDARVIEVALSSLMSNLTSKATEAVRRPL